MSGSLGYRNPYGPSWRSPEADPNSVFAENFVRSFLFDSGVAREATLQVGRLRELANAAGPSVPGFNPFRDADLSGYEDSLHLFRDAGSPERVALTKARITEIRRRAAALEDSGASMSRFLSGMVAPENLVAMALSGGIGGPIARRALLEAGANIGAEGFNQWLNARTLPESLQSQSVVGDLALAGIFGGLIGAGSGLSAGWARQRAARYAAAHDVMDGQRTAGVPELDMEAERLAAGREPVGPLARSAPDAAPSGADAGRPALEAPGLDIPAFDLSPRQVAAVRVRAEEGLESLEALNTRAAVRARSALDSAGDDAQKLVEAHDEIWRLRWEAEARLHDERLPLRETQAGGGGGGEAAPPGGLPAGAGSAGQPPVPGAGGGTPPAPPGGSPPGGGTGRSGQPPSQIGGPRGDDNALKEGAGVEMLRTRQMPWYQLKNNRLPEAVSDAYRRLADRIATSPGMWLKGNRRGVAKAIAAEDRAKGWRARAASAQQAMAEAYYAERNWQTQPGAVRSKLVDLAQTVGVERSPGMSFAEFRQEVGKAVFDNGQHANPNVARAAEAWLELVARPMGDEAARLGIIATSQHRSLAMPALQRRVATATDHLRLFTDLRNQLAAAGAPAGSLVPRNARGAGGQDPRLLTVESVIDHLKRRRESLSKRVAALQNAVDLVDEGYFPHRWMKETVAARRDEFVDRLARWWGSQADPTPEQRWAPPEWRAEIAAAHVLGEKVGDTMERLVRRMMTGFAGLPTPVIDAMAKQAVTRLREMLVNVEPTRWKQEVRSALGLNDSNAPAWAKEDKAAQASALPAVKQEIERLLRLHSRGQQFDVDQTTAQVLANAVGDGDVRGGVFYRPHSALERKLNVPGALFSDFLETDAEVLGQSYVRYMGASIELARELGDEAGIVTRERLLYDTLTASRGDHQKTLEEVFAADRAAGELIEKVSGVYRAPENPDAMSVRVLQNLSHLALTAQMGQALFASLTDVGRVQMAIGLRDFLRSAYSATVTDRAAWKAAGLEAQLAGAAQEVSSLARWQEMTGAIGAETTRSAGERILGSIAGNMPFLNLVAVWTDEIKKFTGAYLQHQFVDRAERIAAGTATPREIEEMARYGIDADKARRIAQQYRATGAQQAGPLKLADTLSWTDEVLVRDFRAALAGAIDTAVVTPGAADRPNFMSGPLQSAIFMYKGFAVSSTQRILASGLQQRDAKVVSGMLASLSLAWLIHGAPDGPYDRDPVASWERLLGAVDRSGVLGVLPDINSTLEAVSENGVGLRPMLGVDPPAYARSGGWGRQVGAVAGPVFAPWLRMGWALSSDEADTNQVLAAARRLQPLNNAFGFNEIWNGTLREVSDWNGR